MNTTPDPTTVREIAREHMTAMTKRIDDICAPLSTTIADRLPGCDLIDEAPAFYGLLDAVQAAISVATVTVSWPDEQPQDERDGDVRAVAALIETADSHYRELAVALAVDDLRARFADRIAELNARDAEAGEQQ